MVCAVDVGVQANGGFEREWTERRTDAVNFQEKVFFFETVICSALPPEWHRTAQTTK